jgi:hypothetical protein
MVALQSPVHAAVIPAAAARRAASATLAGRPARWAGTTLAAGAVSGIVAVISDASSVATMRLRSESSASDGALSA